MYQRSLAPQATPTEVDGPEFVLDCFTIASRNKVETAPSPEPASVKAHVAQKSITKKATPTGYGSEWKPGVGAKVRRRTLVLVLTCMQFA